MGYNRAFVEVDENGRETYVLEREWNSSGRVLRIELGSGCVKVIENGETLSRERAIGFSNRFKSDDDTLDRSDCIVAGFDTEFGSLHIDDAAEMAGAYGKYVYDGKTRVVVEKGTEAASRVDSKYGTSDFTSSYYDDEMDEVRRQLDFL